MPPRNARMADRCEPLPIVQLVDGDLLLRPYRTDDAPALYAAVRESVESIARWLPWCHAGYTEADATSWIAHCAEAWGAENEYTFAIFDAARAQLLGSVGLSQRDRTHNFAGLGYWTRESARGRGIAARAGRMVAAFGFNDVRLGRIEILAAVANRASCRTAEAIGGRFEGIARNRLITPQGLADAAVYALIPSDYAEAQSCAISS